MPRITISESDERSFHCPGCDGGHQVPVKGSKAWGWNGSLSAPTLTPSILIRTGPMPTVPAQHKPSNQPMLGPAARNRSSTRRICGSGLATPPKRNQARSHAARVGAYIGHVRDAGRVPARDVLVERRCRLEHLRASPHATHHTRAEPCIAANPQPDTRTAPQESTAAAWLHASRPSQHRCTRAAAPGGTTPRLASAAPPTE